MLDDGTPPPQSVAIQMVCRTNPHTQGYTDSKGQFSFQLGQQLGVMPDASEDSLGRNSSMNGGMSGMNGGGPMSSSGIQRTTALMGCALNAVLAGYRSSTLDLTNHRSLDDPDVGTIVLHRVGNVEGTTVSATTALAPKDARKAFEKASSDMKKNKWEEAHKELEKATSIYPKYAVAWYELGEVEDHNHNDDAAKKAYEQAVAADPKYVNPYAQLAAIAIRARNWPEAKEATDRLLRLDAVNFPEMWYYNALANFELKEYAASEKSVRAGLKADSDHAIPRMHQLLAALLAGKQDYAGAADALKAYLAEAPNSPDVETTKKQLAAVEQKVQASAAPTPDSAPPKPDQK